MIKKHKDITDKILKAYYSVYNKLGYCFLEKIYENSLAIEIKKLGLPVVQQPPIKVYYDSAIVGSYYADLLVANAVLVEIKATRAIAAEHEAQLLNYLKATHYEVGLLLNFGPEPKIKRKIFENDFKGNLNWTKKRARKN